MSIGIQMILGPTSLSQNGELIIQLLAPENMEYEGTFVELKTYGLRKSEIEVLIGYKLRTIEDLVRSGLDKLAYHDLHYKESVVDYIKAMRHENQQRGLEQSHLLLFADM